MASEAVALSQSGSGNAKAKRSLNWTGVAVNIIVTVVTALCLLLGREMFFTWQRVNALWNYAIAQENARAQAQQPKPPQIVTPEAPTKK